MKLNQYNLIEEYKKYGENFNLTGDDSHPIWIKDYTDAELLREIEVLCEHTKLHWKEEWLFIFRHAYSNRRKEKLKKLNEYR